MMKNIFKKNKKISFKKICQAKVKDSHFFVFYFFISNLSLCDTLYIILSCIQTISCNYKG